MKILIFILCGAVLLCFFSPMITMLCLQPANVTKDSPENLRNEIGSQFLKIIGFSAILWAFLGAMLGLIAYFSYISRPAGEHFDGSPQEFSVGFPYDPSGRLRKPAFFSGPKTVAERNAGCITTLIASVISFTVVLAVIPRLPIYSEVLKLSPTGPRIVAAIAIVVMSVNITPFSLRILEKLGEQRRY